MASLVNCFSFLLQLKSPMYCKQYTEVTVLNVPIKHYMERNWLTNSINSFLQLSQMTASCNLYTLACIDYKKHYTCMSLPVSSSRSPCREESVSSEEPWLLQPILPIQEHRVHTATSPKVSNRWLHILYTLLRFVGQTGICTAITADS